MLFQRINRSDPEKIFMVFKNSYSTASLTNGQPVILDYATDADGVSITKPTASNEAGGKHAGFASAGIVAETIDHGSYGLVQVYGYHSAVRARSLTGGTPAIAAGVPLTQISAVFALESFPLSVVATSTATQALFFPIALALGAQASWTTKTVAAFIKALG